MEIKLKFTDIEAFQAIAKMHSYTSRGDPELYVRLKLKDDYLSVSYYGEYSQVSIDTTLAQLDATSVGADKECDIFTPADKLSKALNNINWKTNATMKIDANTILISSGKRRFKLPLVTDFVPSDKPTIKVADLNIKDVEAMIAPHSLITSRTGYVLIDSDGFISCDSSKRYVVCHTTNDQISIPKAVKFTPVDKEERDIRTTFTTYTKIMRSSINMISDYADEETFEMSFVIPSEVPAQLQLAVSTEYGELTQTIRLLDSKIHDPMVQIKGHVDTIDVSSECVPSVEFVSALNAATVTEESKLDAIVLLSNTSDIQKMNIRTPDEVFVDEVGVETTCEFNVSVRPSYLSKIMNSGEGDVNFTFGTKTRAFLVNKENVTYMMGCLIDPALGMKYDIKETAVVDDKSGSTEEGAVQQPV